MPHTPTAIVVVQGPRAHRGHDREGQQQIPERRGRISIRGIMTASSQPPLSRDRAQHEPAGQRDQHGQHAHQQGDPRDRRSRARGCHARNSSADYYGAGLSSCFSMRASAAQDRRARAKGASAALSASTTISTEADHREADCDTKRFQAVHALVPAIRIHRLARTAGPQPATSCGLANAIPWRPIRGLEQAVREIDQEVDHDGTRARRPARALQQDC